jgi:hypothetical protein
MKNCISSRNPLRKLSKDCEGNNIIEFLKKFDHSRVLIFSMLITQFIQQKDTNDHHNSLLHLNIDSDLIDSKLETLTHFIKNTVYFLFTPLHVVAEEKNK